MKPKPLVALNHFTVPFGMTRAPFYGGGGATAFSGFPGRAR
jgi:hypothetical protein